MDCHCRSRGRRWSTETGKNWYEAGVKHGSFYIFFYVAIVSTSEQEKGKLRNVSYLRLPSAAIYSRMSNLWTLYILRQQ